MIRKLISPLIIIIVFFISLILVLNSPSLSNGTATIIRDDFVLSFLGIFSSLAIAIITFLYSNIERIRESVVENKNIKDKGTFENKTLAIFKELQHDTIFIFFSLVGCFLLILLRNIDFSLIRISMIFISKIQLIASLELSLILLTFVSVIDIIGSLFNLVEISSLVTKHSEENK